MSFHMRLAIITMVETPYGGLMACRRLPDIARVVCNKFWESNENCQHLKSSMYKPIKDYHEFDSVFNSLYYKQIL